MKNFATFFKGCRKVLQKAGKNMQVAVLNTYGMTLVHFIPNSQTVAATCRYYSEVILKTTSRKTEKVASQASPEKCLSFAWQCPLSYCFIYSKTYQLLQVAIVVPSACIKGSLGVIDSQKLPWDFQKSMPGSLGLLTFKDVQSFITKL